MYLPHGRKKKYKDYMLLNKRNKNRKLSKKTDKSSVPVFMSEEEAISMFLPFS